MDNKTKKEVIDLIQSELKNLANLNTCDVITLLRNYNKYKSTIKSIRNNLDSRYVSNNSTVIEKVQQSKVYDDPLIKSETTIEHNLHKIEQLNYIVYRIDIALDVVSHDEYFDLIRLRFIEHTSVADVLLKCNVSMATYKRHVNRLLKELKSIFIL